jgi:monoamine oxidase
MERKECVVIGAGLAGLAAAYHLTQKRSKVMVVEATRRLGVRALNSAQIKNPNQRRHSENYGDSGSRHT